MRRFTFISSAAVVALSIIATTFVLLTLKSPRWSSQTYYFALNGQSDGTKQFAPLCVATRSPFYRCGVPQVARNGSCLIPDCHWYKPYGNRTTSCRSWTEIGIAGNDLAGAHGLFGTSQECQQIHYAGNLQIAASVFITLGLILSLALAALAVLRVPNAKGKHATQDTPSEPLAVESRRSSSVLAYTPVVLVFFLYIGAVLQVLAQFFGILGLIVNPTPNGGDATASQHKKLLNNFAAHEWVMDKGLTTYATVAWTSAVLCAVIATAVFRRPRVHTIKI